MSRLGAPGPAPVCRRGPPPKDACAAVFTTRGVVWVNRVVPATPTEQAMGTTADILGVVGGGMKPTRGTTRP